MHTNDERQLEHWVHWTLLSGLAVSAVLLIIGMLAALVQENPTSEPRQPLSDLVTAATAFDGQALTTLGLLVLMITPILRVVVLLVGWTWRRDWTFAAVAVVVLALLIVSLSLGVG